jgi:hypothetical protein
MVRKLPRSQMRGFLAQSEPSLAGTETCGEGYYWSRESTRLGLDKVPNA